MVSDVKVATTQEELSRIYILRYAVYVEEMGFPYSEFFNEQKKLYDDLDSTATHFYMEADDEVVGIYRLNSVDYKNIDPEMEKRYAFSVFSTLGLHTSLSSKFMIRKDFRSIQMMQKMIKAVFEYGAKNEYFLNFIDCSPKLVSFYRRLGYMTYHVNFVDPILGVKTPMVLFANDKAILRNTNRLLSQVMHEQNVGFKDYSQWYLQIFKKDVFTQ